MEKLLLLLLGLLFVPVYCSSDELVDYYVNLIQSEQERAQNFVLPNDSKDAKPETNNYINYGIFDHIIIGAGSAGAIIASRLSEDSFRNVLLLEAGGPETNFTDIPGMSGFLLNLEYNWNYHTVPQTNCCLGMIEERCAYARGKAISGSSAVNGMLYTRGSKKDFDIWCDQGNPGWSYDDVLPFFIKSENSEIIGDPYYHGAGGEVNVEYTRPRTEKHVSFVEANLELGRPFLDYNGERQEGVGFTQFTQKNGRRQSTGRAFLDPVLHRRNLKILTYSHVTKILIHPWNKRAYGVLFAHNKQYYMARSRHDIVVSAGTIGSPQLLMLSGIGPKKHLDSLGIRVFQDLSVGMNFQDHISFGALHFITKFSDPIKSLEENVKEYLDGFGLLTDSFNTKVISYLQNDLQIIDDFSDIEIIQVSSFTDYFVYKPLFNYKPDVYEQGWSNFNTSKSFTAVIALMRPESRGYLELKSSNPFDYPIINPKFLSDPDLKDIETIYQGIQLALQLLETTAFKKLGAQLHRVHLPECEQYQYLTKEFWYCHIRQIGTPFAHPVGTCKMGPNPLEGAVVDHKLRVHGINNLRVADASIMPTEPGAHLHAPAMMIGEKAAHMIRFE